MIRTPTHLRFCKCLRKLFSRNVVLDYVSVGFGWGSVRLLDELVEPADAVAEEEFACDVQSIGEKKRLYVDRITGFA